MPENLVKNGVVIKVGDHLACKTQEFASVEVIEIAASHVKLRWLEDLKKMKHALYDMTQEFSLGTDAFLSSNWRKVD